MSKSSRIISYMEERYGKSFTYVGETNGIFGSGAFTARLSCPEYPEDVILASWRQEGSEEYYADNYMAVCYHNSALEKIDEAVKQVFADYQLLFRVPDVLLTIEEPTQYMPEDYLADPLAFKTVYILVREEVDETAFEALTEAFGNADISVRGLLAVPENLSETVGITQDNVDDFLADESRVKVQVNFNLENGKLIYEDWRQ